MDTKTRFNNLIGQVSVNYSRKMTEADISNFKVMAKKWGLDKFEKAVRDHMFDPDQGMFYPTIANIAKHVVGTTKQNEQGVTDRAELAWMDIEKKISSVGAYGSLKLEDKQALAAAQSLGSWRDLCHTATDKLTWKKKEFIEAYKNFENADLALLPNHLSGLVDQERQKRTNENGLVNLKNGLNKFNQKLVEDKG